VPGFGSDRDTYLDVRLDVLRRNQNSDGGWGYFPGKASWLEPTAYAALALAGDPAADRAWKLLSSWQLPDGSWKPSADVNMSSWGTSLCATIAMARNEWGTPLRNSVSWLVGSTGIESGRLNVIFTRLGLVKQERDISLKAWPWKPGNSGWVEPTVHALVALKLAATKLSNRELRDRVRMGEAQLLDVRSRDGGWNYGSPAALGVDLPSFPETTALALVALQGRSDLGKAFDLALRQIGETPSPLARAWLTIAMRLHGVKTADLTGDPPDDVMITALEALAAPQGNYKLMQCGTWLKTRTLRQTGTGAQTGATA
jgi:hypothetical protein